MIRSLAPSLRRSLRSLSTSAALEWQLSASLSEMQDNGTYKVERVITTPQNTSIATQDSSDSFLPKEKNLWRQKREQAEINGYFSE